MTPNRPKSAKKSGSRKSSADAMQTRLPQDHPSSFSLLSKTQNLDRAGDRGGQKGRAAPPGLETSRRRGAGHRQIMERGFFRATKFQGRTLEMIERTGSAMCLLHSQ